MFKVRKLTHLVKDKHFQKQNLTLSLTMYYFWGMVNLLLFSGAIHYEEFHALIWEVLVWRDRKQESVGCGKETSLRRDQIQQCMDTLHGQNGLFTKIAPKGYKENPGYRQKLQFCDGINVQAYLKFKFRSPCLLKLSCTSFLSRKNIIDALSGSNILNPLSINNPCCSFRVKNVCLYS